MYSSLLSWIGDAAGWGRNLDSSAISSQVGPYRSRKSSSLFYKVECDGKRPSRTSETPSPQNTVQIFATPQLNTRNACQEPSIYDVHRNQVFDPLLQISTFIPCKDEILVKNGDNFFTWEKDRMTSVDSNFNFLCGRSNGAWPPPPRPHAST